MGIECILLRMELEDEFEIDLKDADFTGVQTVQDLLAVVTIRLRGKCGVPFESYPALPAFCEVRRILQNVLDVPRSSVRPSTPLDAVLPRVGRGRAWRRLAEALGQRLPEVKPPRWAAPAYFSVMMLFNGAGIVWMVNNEVDPAYICKLVLFSAWLTLLAWLLSAAFLPAFAAVIPDEMTVRSLVQARVEQENRRREKAASPTATSDEIFRRLKRIVSEVLGIPLDEVTPNSRLIEDLRIV
jgi:acyl carrier protein